MYIHLEPIMASDAAAIGQEDVMPCPISACDARRAVRKSLD